MTEKSHVHDIGRRERGFDSNAGTRFLCLSKAWFGPKRPVAADNSKAGPAFVDMARNIGSYTRQQLVGNRPAWLSPPHTALNSRELPTFEDDGCTAHPPNHSAPEGQASFASAAAAPCLCPSAPLRCLRQSRAVRGSACAHRYRRWCWDEARRSLCHFAVQRLPRKTALDWRAFVLVGTTHRSSRRRFAALDCIGRYQGWGAHGVSGPSTDRSG